MPSPVEFAKGWIKRGIREVTGKAKVSTKYPKASHYATWNEGDSPSDIKVIKYKESLKGFYHDVSNKCRGV